MTEPAAPEPDSADGGTRAVGAGVGADAGVDAAAAAPAHAPADPVAAEPPGPPAAKETIGARIRSALSARGPLTGHELARALDEQADQETDGRLQPVAGREGAFYAVLLSERLRGGVHAAWRNRPEGRRCVWSADAPAPDGAPPPIHEGASEPHVPPPLPRDLEDAARRAVASLSFAPRVGEEVRVQLAGHLADAFARRRAEGAGESDAAARALADFGDAWRVSKDLASAARGGRVAAFPANGLESLTGALRQDLPMIGGVLAAILFVRMFLLTAFHIPTKSMEPTLHGHHERGDRILVWKAAGAPERFDLEVFDGWGRDRKHFVKRTVGLPGEEVRFREGDLWIDGRVIRKEGAHLDAMLFAQFDLECEKALASRSGASPLTERLRDLWATSSGQWTVNAEGTFEGRAATDAAVLRFEPGTTHSYLDGESCELRGRDDIQVADARIEALVQPADGDARVALRLRRGDETVEAVLCGDEPGVAITLDGKVVAHAATPVAPGRATRVRFSRVDHVLRLDVDGAEVLRHDLADPAAPRRDGPAGGVEIVVRAGSARVRPVRIERDVHWTTEYGEVNEGTLGPDEFFMAGDNSANSSDSRSYGPVHRSRLVGRPLLVMWPFARFGVPR